MRKSFYIFRSIDVFKAPALKLLCSVQKHHKIINALRWHHEHSAQSDLQYLLASGSSNATIYIHDLRSAIGQNSSLNLSPDSSLNALLLSVFISYRNPIREFSSSDWTLQDSVWTHQQNHQSGLEPSSRRASGDGVLRRHSSGKFVISYSHKWGAEYCAGSVCHRREAWADKFMGTKWVYKYTNHHRCTVIDGDRW